MWAELFLANKDNILKELSGYIQNLEQYRNAIENSDYETLVSLLDEGKKRKEEVDG
jgi:prephenate dehydrogenase